MNGESNGENQGSAGAGEGQQGLADFGITGASNRELTHLLLDAMPPAALFVYGNGDVISNFRWRNLWFPRGDAPPLNGDWAQHHAHYVNLAVDKATYHAAWESLKEGQFSEIIQRCDGVTLHRRCRSLRDSTGGSHWLLLDEDLAVAAEHRWDYERHRLEARARWAELTSRERSVLDLIHEGKTNRQAASILQISEKTVEKHRATGMRRLGCRHVPDLVRLAVLVDCAALFQLPPPQPAGAESNG